MVRKIAILLAFCLILAGCGTRDAGEYDLDTARIRADTEHLCSGIGIRVTGTDKEREAADWIMESLRTAGFSEAPTAPLPEGFFVVSIADSFSGRSLVPPFIPQDVNKAPTHVVNANAKIMIFLFNIAFAPYSSLCANLTQSAWRKISLSEKSNIKTRAFSVIFGI